MLNKFEQSKRRLQLQFQGDTSHYSCTVESVNADHGILLISNIFPSPASLHQYKNRKLVLATTESGDRIQLASKFLEPLISGSTQFLMLTLPGKLQVSKEQEAFQARPAGVNSTRNHSVAARAAAATSESQAA